MKIEKEDLTLRELNSLNPIGKLFQDLEFDQQDYFKDECGQVYEVTYYVGDQKENFDKRIKDIETYFKKKEIMKCLGF